MEFHFDTSFLLIFIDGSEQTRSAGMVKARHAGAQHGHAVQIVNTGDIRLRGCSPRVGANPTMTDKITIQGVDTIC